jgi:hypothetical protein
MKKFVYVDYDMENPVNKQFLLYEKDIDNIWILYTNFSLSLEIFCWL